MSKPNKERDAADRQQRLEAFLCSGLVLHLQKIQARVNAELDLIDDVIEKRQASQRRKRMSGEGLVVLVLFLLCAMAYYWYIQARTVTKETLDLFRKAGELEAKRDAELLLAEKAATEAKEIKGDTEEEKLQRRTLAVDQMEHEAHAAYSDALATIARERAAAREVSEAVKRKRAKTPDKK